MAYVKQNFTDGSKLYASQLNHIEDGIADNNTMIVTVTYDAETEEPSVDKLAYEIYTANNSGRRVIIRSGYEIDGEISYMYGDLVNSSVSSFGGTTLYTVSFLIIFETQLLHIYAMGTQTQNAEVYSDAFDTKQNIALTLDTPTESGTTLTGKAVLTNDTSTGIGANGIVSYSESGKNLSLSVTSSTLGNTYILPFSSYSKSGSTVTSCKFSKVFITATTASSITLMNMEAVVTNASTANTTVTWTTNTIEQLSAWSGGSY